GDKGNAAKGHFNPDKVKHGFLPKDGFQNAHAGDFGNITISSDGKGTLSETVPGLTLSGPKYAIKGLSVILHEKADDFGQPLGNAGGRIGCGIITTKDA
ncbi:MAG TPA: superoxide dismutase family protein, partial [Cyanobacteria bacterium UBA8543]|nr:superoxide dismutase family protein [Cyanobacteria bacterium UBA8543]